tara:strand:+ start:4808 stop:6148 length:1341 start_codon:yes stop_codon:yes gene_type:complete
MSIEFLKKIFYENSQKDAIIFDDIKLNYSFLLEKIEFFKEIIKSNNINSKDVVGIIGDFSPNSVSLLLSLIENKSIIVPISINDKNLEFKLNEIAKVNYIFKFNEDEKFTISCPKNNSTEINFYNIIRKRNNPGLVLFSSGTSGEPKAAVHDFTKLLEKFKVRRKSLITINFLLFDHWGGLNTMLHILSNAGTLVVALNRSPDTICQLIEKNGVELLPSSPSFLNMLILSNSYKRFNLKSLKIISYGTEPMPKTTLEKLSKIFPNTLLQQTYGLIELGVMRTKSESNGSLWLKIGGEGYSYRIKNGLLEIKADSAMIGYLNAPSPFTDDGWYMTGDQVETKGEYLKILGRKSEIINVGGDKVYPQEVENIILQIKNIADATVYGEKNPILGSIVCCKVSLIKKEEKKAVRERIKSFCDTRLEKFKVPVKVEIVNNLNIGQRLKKKR